MNQQQVSSVLARGGVYALLNLIVTEKSSLTETVVFTGATGLVEFIAGKISEQTMGVGDSYWNFIDEFGVSRIGVISQREFLASASRTAPTIILKRLCMKMFGKPYWQGFLRDLALTFSSIMAGDVVVNRTYSGMHAKKHGVKTGYDYYQFKYRQILGEIPPS